MYPLMTMNYKHSSWNRPVLDSLGQFWTVKDGLNLVLDTVRPKPSFGRPKPNPARRISYFYKWSLGLSPELDPLGSGEEFGVEHNNFTNT